MAFPWCPALPVRPGEQKDTRGNRWANNEEERNSSDCTRSNMMTDVWCNICCSISSVVDAKPCVVLGCKTHFKRLFLSWSLYIQTDRFGGCTPRSWLGSRSSARGWPLWSRFLWRAEPCRSIPKSYQSENCWPRCPSETKTQQPQARRINTRLHFRKGPNM